jgi:hypothetical protein
LRSSYEKKCGVVLVKLVLAAADFCFRNFR